MKNLGKKVVDVNNGKFLGYVLDVALDFEKLVQKGFYVVDEETEGEYLLRFDDIESIADFITISDFTKLEFISSRKESLIGKTVISDNGMSYGEIEEILFDKKKVNFICTNKCQIPSKMVSYVGDDCVMLKSRTSKRRVSVPYKDVFEEPKVTIFLENKEKAIPEKINLSYNFFSGKLSTLDVFGYNNERIVSKNEKITKNIFENAKKHNKLNELFFAIKK